MKTLVAIDGSEASFAALGSACRIAAKTGAYVTALYVNKGAEYTAEEMLWPGLKEKIEDELEASGPRIMARASAIGRRLGLQIEGVMAYGVPAEELAKYVAVRGIVNLVVLGHSSKGKGAQGFVGSTTRMVLSTVGRAALLVTSREEEIARILVAVDDTEASLKAAATAGRLAQALAAEVRLVSVFPDIDAIRQEYRQIAEVPNLDKYVMESQATLRQKARLAVEKAQGVLDPLGLRVSSLVKEGHPPRELAAESADADLTVIGLKSKPDQKKIGRILGTLLNRHEISLLCVQ